MVQWFRSYLSDRTQLVRIDSVLSDPLPITHGVPQGAILPPLLFCIYINDLPGAPQFSQLESYVDDSKVLLSFPVNDVNNAKTKLEKDLRNVAFWCCKNDLLINPDKTKFMLIGTRQMMSKHSVDFTVSFMGKSLTTVESAKDPGVYIDAHLTYDTHISHLVSSCLSKLVQINRTKHSFDRETLLLIITSLVFSKLLYCSTVWANTSAKNLQKLQLIQNFACKIITGGRKYDHVTPLLKELNWLPVSETLKFRDAIMAYKCFNNLAPDYLCSKLKKTILYSQS